MAISFVRLSLVVFALSLPVVAHTQGFGPGTIDGIKVEPPPVMQFQTSPGLPLSKDQSAAFRLYVIGQHKASYQFRENIHIGVILPFSGVRYFKVPPEYGAAGYLYSVVNTRTVLVDPGTQEIVQIVE